MPGVWMESMSCDGTSLVPNNQELVCWYWLNLPNPSLSRLGLGIRGSGLVVQGLEFSVQGLGLEFRTWSIASA